MANKADEALLARLKISFDDLLQGSTTFRVRSVGEVTTNQRLSRVIEDSLLHPAVFRERLIANMRYAKHTERNDLIKSMMVIVMMQTYCVVLGCPCDLVDSSLLHRSAAQSLAGTHLYPGDVWPVGSTRRRYRSTKVYAVNLDTVVAAKGLFDQGLNPCALNMANSTNPGGGYLRGARAQEEDLMRRSNYCQVLAHNPPPENYRQQLPELHPIPEFGAVYSPDVCFFRGIASSGYPFIEPYTLSLVACAAYDRPRTIREGGTRRLIAARALGTKKKIRAILNVASLHGHDSVVLSAFGCGAFKNPPHHVAELFYDVIVSEYAGVFREICFGIIGDHNDIQGNYKIFASRFGTADRPSVIEVADQDRDQQHHSSISTRDSVSFHDRDQPSSAAAQPSIASVPPPPPPPPTTQQLDIQQLTPSPNSAPLVSFPSVLSTDPSSTSFSIPEPTLFSTQKDSRQEAAFFGDSSSSDDDDESKMDVDQEGSGANPISNEVDRRDGGGVSARIGAMANLRNDDVGTSPSFSLGACPDGLDCTNASCSNHHPPRWNPLVAQQKFGRLGVDVQGHSTVGSHGHGHGHHRGRGRSRSRGGRPRCQYFYEGCRRKNPDHARQFRHPKGWTPGSGLRPASRGGGSSLRHHQHRQHQHQHRGGGIKQALSNTFQRVLGVGVTPECRFGRNCYRLNPDHAREESHPRGWNPVEVCLRLGQTIPQEYLYRLKQYQDRIRTSGRSGGGSGSGNRSGRVLGTGTSRSGSGGASDGSVPADASQPQRRRQRCPYGVECQVMDSQHRSLYSHE